MTDPERDIRDMMQRTVEGLHHVPRPSRRLVRRARLARIRTAAFAVTAALALVIGGFVATRSLSIDDAAPVQPAEENQQEGASRRPIELLNGEVTFRSDGDWEQEREYRTISEAPMGAESLLRLGGPNPAAFLVIADPAPREESCSSIGATVASAETLASAIRANPGLTSTDPVAEQIAGIDALRLDLSPSDGAFKCAGGGATSFAKPPNPVGVPVVTGTRETELGPPLVYVAEDGQRMRLYLLDLPGGAARTLAIVIVAAEEDFNAAVAAARPILDSFEFHRPQQ
jgi:hypothetical protein